MIFIKAGGWRYKMKLIPQVLHASSVEGMFTTHCLSCHTSLGEDK